MKKKQQAHRFPPLDEILDPETRDFASQCRSELKRRNIPKSPQKADYQTLRDLCLYVFKRVAVNGEYCMAEDGSVLKTWVWCGHDFTDGIVEAVAEVAPRLSDTDKLAELRLVATCVSEAGVKRLHSTFPKARVLVFSDDDFVDDPNLSQANYRKQS